ncbi:MAG: hypothetical protein AAF340_03615 [Pseudomonadota bacterium]
MFDLEELDTLESSLLMRERAIKAAKRCTESAFRSHSDAQERLDASRKILEAAQAK